MLKKWVGITSVLLLLLMGCSKEKPLSVEKEKATSKVQNNNESKSLYSSPLTGVPTKNPSDDRAVAVMINNHPEARPQSGLTKADFVYELLAEGEVTRFLAIFQSEHPDNIGPVRSARKYYIDLANGLHALYVCHGSSPEAEQMMANGEIDSLDGMHYDGTLFKRASFRVAPHNSYITYNRVLEGAKENKFKMKGAPTPLKFLSKDEIKKLDGVETKTVNVNYSNSAFNVSYKYNAAKGKYERFSNGEQTIDYDTKDPVLLDNIFIIETNHQVVDDSGRREIDLQSGGNGYLIQKGKRQLVEWKNVDGQILPFVNGSQAAFAPGKTWVNVIPTSPGLEQAVNFE